MYCSMLKPLHYTECGNSLSIKRIRTCFMWMIFVTSLLVATPSYAILVTGSGIVALNTSNSWVVGETITLSFEFETSSFGDDVSSSPEIGEYHAQMPIPLTVTGSTSGSISTLGPIFRAVAWHVNPDLDIFNFENSNTVVTMAGSSFSKSLYENRYPGTNRCIMRLIIAR